MHHCSLQRPCTRTQASVYRASPVSRCRSMSSRQTRAACTSNANSAEDWTRYTSGLSPEQQADALSKLSAAGFTGALAQFLPNLGHAELENIGIQPHAVRTALMYAFSQIRGDGKEIVLVDSNGTEERWFFYKRNFEMFICTDGILKQQLPEGVLLVIGAWEHLEEGAKYLTDRLLEGQVCDAIAEAIALDSANKFPTKSLG